MRRKDANVSWKALMIHVDSDSVNPRSRTREGMAENSAELLNASRNCAKQNTSSRKYRRATEYCCGRLPSTRVWHGEIMGTFFSVD